MSRWRIAAILVLLLPLAAIRLQRVTVSLGVSAANLARWDSEQRRVAYYGDECSGMGYAYVTRALARLPDPAVRPVVKYPDWNRYGNVVLAGSRWEIDPRLLIGIELTDDDLRVKTLDAKPRSSVTGSAFTFQTGPDFDLLSGIDLTLAPPVDATSIRVDVYSLVNRRQRLGSWEIPVNPSQPRLEFTLPEPVTAFSIGRGGMDFLIDVDAYVSALDVRLARVDLRRYTIVQRDGACFTALRDDAPASWRGRFP